MATKAIEQQGIEDLLHIDMVELLSQHFQYGMTIDGVLLHGVEDNVVAIYIINHDYMSLIYKCETGDFSGYVKQKVSLDWLSSQYGDKKADFICPDCGNRAMILYSSGISFMCRKCIQADRTQHMNDKERTASIESKLQDGTIMDSACIIC